MTCPEMNKHLAESVFESRPLPDEARKHIAECAGCAAELAGMESTWKLLDEWQAPEPSAFFDAKLYARLRVEQTTAPASFFERAKAWLLYSSNLQMRPLAAGASGHSTGDWRWNLCPARLPARNACGADLGHGA